MVNKEIEEGKTALEIFGFTDITKVFFNKELDYVYQDNVIRGISILRGRLENHKGKMENVYDFSLPKYNLEGRIFPFDEVVDLSKPYDIVIKNFRRGIHPRADAQIYHELYKGEELKVRISRKSLEGEPSFKIFNHITGFVKDGRNGLYERIHEGSKILVEVFDLKKGRKGHYIKVWPLKILDDEQKYS